MRTWVYSYKTSDGLRHEGEMQAPSKDAVYTELRKQGIRAIRVDERIAPVINRGLKGLRKRDWLFLAAILIVSVVGVTAFLSLREETAPVATAGTHLLDSTNPAYLKLMESVQREVETYRKALDAVDREVLANYALVYHSKNLDAFLAEIEKGRRVCEMARNAVHAVYANLYGNIPGGLTEEQIDAQRTYGSVMEAIDADEERLSTDECALVMLDSNRGKWQVRKGEVVWSDPDLDAQFSMFCRVNMAAGTSRWQRDFGSSKSISSEIISVEGRLAPADKGAKEK